MFKFFQQQMEELKCQKKVLLTFRFPRTFKKKPSMKLLFFGSRGRGGKGRAMTVVPFKEKQKHVLRHYSG